MGQGKPEIPRREFTGPPNSDLVHIELDTSAWNLDFHHVSTMGNVFSCSRASSTSDSDAQYQQLLRELRANPDISWDNLDSLMDCMDFIFSKLKQPNEASSSSSVSVAQSATIGRSIVDTLSTQIESQVTATTSKYPGIGRISGSGMKQYVRAALNSRTMKLVGDVLDKTQKIPYIGVTSCIVVYLLEQYEKSSSNVEEITKLLEHLHGQMPEGFLISEYTTEDTHGYLQKYPQASTSSFQNLLCF